MDFFLYILYLKKINIKLKLFQDFCSKHLKNEKNHILLYYIAHPHK